jgi:hypothetical protein
MRCNTHGKAMMMMMVVVAGTVAAVGASVTISNVHPRLSTTGEIVNAHDGTVR